MSKKPTEAGTCGQCFKFIPFPETVTPLDVARMYNVKITDASVAMQVTAFAIEGGEHFCSFPKVRTRGSTCQRAKEYLPRPK